MIDDARIPLTVAAGRTARTGVRMR